MEETIWRAHCIWEYLEAPLPCIVNQLCCTTPLLKPSNREGVMYSLTLLVAIAMSY